jgi:hypothetical protein
MQRLRFNLYAADAVLTSQGTFSLRSRTDPKVGISRWIKLPYDIIDLEPRTQLVVPFTIDPPYDASPGDMPGGIVAEATKGGYSQSGQLGVTVVQAVGARIYARVAGPLHPALAIRGLHVSAKRSLKGLIGGPVDVTASFVVRNVGNELLTPTEQSTFEPLFGSSTSSRVRTLPQLLPGSEVQVTHVFKNVEPYVYAHVKVKVVSPEASASASHTLIVIPWLVVLALFALVAFYLYRRRRRRAQNRTGVEHEGGASSGDDDSVKELVEG